MAPPLPEKLIEDSLEYTIGDVVKTCRLARGWTQADLAERLSLDRSLRTWLTKIERNVVTPRLDSVPRLAIALGVSPYFFALMLDGVYENKVPVVGSVASHQSQDPRETHHRRIN